MAGRGFGRGLIAGALVVSACGGDDVFDPIVELPRQLSTSEQEIIRNANAFGFELFPRVVSAEPGPNVFLSPLSASMALGMVMNGAAGGTWDAMRTTLGLEGLSEADINQSYHGLMELLLELDPSVTLRIGNSVWSREGFPFEQPFFDAVSNYFDAEARALDFSDPSSVDVINRWASDATNGRIDKVLDTIEPHHIMFLLNAIYFKGRWQYQFDPDETRDALFTRADGSEATVRMMNLPAGTRVPYARGEGYEAVELAYGGGAFAMVLVLPERGRSLDALIASLDASTWDGIVESLDTAGIAVSIPKFRLKYEELLNDPLIDMGMGVAFSRSADFTRLTPVAQTDPVCIHFVKQNSFVEVNEEGTEAAAVTTVGIGVVSLPPSFIADRPFLFAIRERLSGTILFIGSIGDPTFEESDRAASPPPPC